MKVISTLPVGTTVRLPYSNRIVTIDRHGAMGTVVRAPSKRRAFEAKVEDHCLTTKAVSFVAKGATTVVAGGTEVEVVA